MEKKSIQISSSKKIELIEITSEIAAIIKRNNFDNGLLTLFVPHTTAGITINESYDPEVAKDMEKALSALVPQVPFRHGEGNSPAHFLSTLIGCHLIIPVRDKQAELGTWQGIFFCELDGPRNRRKVKIYWQK